MENPEVAEFYINYLLPRFGVTLTNAHWDKEKRLNGGDEFGFWFTSNNKRYVLIWNDYQDSGLTDTYIKQTLDLDIGDYTFVEPDDAKYAPSIRTPDWKYEEKIVGWFTLLELHEFKHFIDPLTPVSTKLFFNLHIYTLADDGEWKYLTFQQNGSQQYVADRVMPNNTLSNAIRDELKSDFGVSDWHFIEPVEFADNTEDNRGVATQRVNVFVEVAFFETGDRKVLGMSMEWVSLREEAPIVKREDLITAYKPYVEQGVESPYDIDSAELTAMDDAYHEQQWLLWAKLPPDEQVRASVEETTIYFDAGFTDTFLLEEIADDWLTNDLSRAERMHRRDLADEVKAKIDEIQKRIKELKPDYVLTDWSKDDSWNPSRTASPSDFYGDYAYWKGPANVTVEGALAEYLNYRPDADPQEVKTLMETAAAKYKETA